MINKRFEKDKNEFEDFYKNIKKKNDIELLKKIYYRLKQIAPYYYKNGKINKKYNCLVEKVLECENFFNSDFLINENIDMNNNSNIINSIVNDTRNYLFSIHKYKDINSYSFEGMCAYSAYKVKEICDSKNIECYVINIEPGYLDDSNLFSGCNFHFFNIIKLGYNYYLIDCTYKQFFKVSKTYIERLGIINLSSPRVGAYMMMNERRKNIAKEILKNGYIQLDKENFKDYLDGFTISFRNGLYYEKTNDFSYETNYSANDYINFLNNKDNQLNYEDEKYLGYQKEPLKNIDINFIKK